MIMARHSLVLIVSLVAVGLSGCGDARKVLGYDKTIPDEFRVVGRAPLTIPEAFDLPAPMPGEDVRAQELSASALAYRALTGHTRSEGRSEGTRSPAVTASPGTRAFLHSSGVDHVLPDIRTLVNREAVTTLLEQRTVTDRMVFWRHVIPESGPVVDAEKERHRLQENRALGRPANEGNVPVRIPRQKGLLEHLF